MFIHAYKEMATNLPLRNDGRLFAWMKWHLRDQRKVSEIFLVENLQVLNHFSLYAFTKGLERLAAIGWIGRDGNGNIFLRGREYFMERYNCSAGAAYEAAPLEVTLDYKSWQNWCAAMLVINVVNSVRTTTKPRERNALTLPRNLARAAEMKGVSTAPVSLGVMTSHYDFSEATASRRRSAAAASGFVENIKQSIPYTESHFNPDGSCDVVHLQCDRITFKFWREQQEEPMRYWRDKDGFVFIVLPNFMIVDKFLLRTRRTRHIAIKNTHWSRARGGVIIETLEVAEDVSFEWETYKSLPFNVLNPADCTEDDG